MKNNRIYKSIYTAQYSNLLGVVSVLTPSIRLSSFRYKPDLTVLDLRSSNACVVDESNKQKSSFRDDTKISFKTKYTN